MKLLPKSLLTFLSRAARPYLRTQGLLLTAKLYNRSALVYDPGNEVIVVIAPHMDDEVIGCGGTLVRHLAAGAKVTVVFLTDGRRGGGNIPPATLTQVRKNEAHRALAELGITDAIFLDAADSEVIDTAELGLRLREHLLRIRPDLVYLPFFLEEHPDHRAASYVLRDAVRGTDLHFRCHGYEVWTPLFPNCLVNIDTSVEIKRRAIAHYQSQVSESDYLHTALGLNAYRSSAFLSNCRFAEAFCAMPLRQYLQLLDAYGRFTTSPRRVDGSSLAVHEGLPGLRDLVAPDDAGNQ